MVGIAVLYRQCVQYSPTTAAGWQSVVFVHQESHAVGGDGQTQHMGECWGGGWSNTTQQQQQQIKEHNMYVPPRHQLQHTTQCLLVIADPLQRTCGSPIVR